MRICGDGIEMLIINRAWKEIKQRNYLLKYPCEYVSIRYKALFRLCNSWIT